MSLADRYNLLVNGILECGRDRLFLSGCEGKAGKAAV